MSTVAHVVADAVAHANVDRRRELPAGETVRQYGALPWRKDRHGRTRLLLITSRTRGRWIVPKGWPVGDRAPYLAAALEAFEEAGVIGEIRPQPLAGYDCLKQRGDGSLRPCHVTLFSLRVRGTLTNWPERGQRQRRWVSLEEAADMVDDAGLAEIIRAIQAAPWTLTDIDRVQAGDDRRQVGALA